MDHGEKQKRKRNPRETSNILSIVTFSYMLGLFKKAFKKELQESDLYEVLHSCRSQSCGDKTEKAWKKVAEKNKKSLSIFRLLVTRFGIFYTYLAIFHLVFTVGKSILEPHLISNLVDCFKSNGTRNEQNATYYGSCLIGMYLVFSFYFYNVIVVEQQLATQIRTSLSSLVYRKALRVTPEAMVDISLGNIITLITKDVQLIEDAIWIFGDGVISIIQTFTICYLLYMKLGFTGFVGIGFILCMFPLQMYLTSNITKVRLKSARKTDERLQIAQEALSAIRIIKMFTWEQYFQDKITEARKKEVHAMMLGFYQKIIMLITGFLGSRIGFYIVVMTYIWLGYSTDTKLIFYVLTLFKELRRALGLIVPIGMARGAEMLAAIIRIGKMLNSDELTIVTNNKKIGKEPFIEMKDISVKIKDAVILNNISLNASKGMTVITGYVGSGKSTLLKTLLRDYSFNKGSLNICGTMSYASQDPWLFPSTIRQNILFGESFNENRYQEILRVCALKYDLDILEDGDQYTITDRGTNLSKGQQARINLARAIYKESDIYLLDDSLTAIDSQVQNFIFKECFQEFLKNKILVLVTQSINHINQADKIVILNEGELKYFGKPNEISLDELSMFEEENIHGYKNGVIENEFEDKGEDSKLLTIDPCIPDKKKIYYESKKEGKVNFKVYYRYFRMGGGLFMFSFIFLLFSGAQFAENYADKLITQWVDLQQKVLDLKSGNNTNNGSIEATVKETDFTINMYSIMTISYMVLMLSCSYLLFNYCRKASLNLHIHMTTNIINATMTFFDTHFIGNILNRFSQDLDTIDELIPFTFTECINVLLTVVGTIVLIVTVDYKFLIPAAIFFVLLYFCRIYFLRTGRTLKRLESLCKSPMIGYINSTLEGLTTIRAYNAQTILQKEFDRHQDLYTSAKYTLACSIITFQFFSDLLTVVVVSVIMMGLIFLETETSAGKAGLVLTQMTVLASSIQWGMLKFVHLENQMTSVERALEYTVIPMENKTGIEPENWPKFGRVVYKNVSLSFGNNTVLNNVCFEVDSQQKIGIVGRTGAGKSSIISTLFKLYNFEGKILIDNIDIQTVSVTFLRQNIAIIPQDPILFTGTLRNNIDPLNMYSDEQIWQAIKQVQLGDLITDLDMSIVENNSNFSAGQKQLLCLARAIIRHNKIVILDEATANMDPENEVLLQNVINEKFSKCTVFIIAHRLNSVLDCHKIMILNRGEIIEYDSPGNLLENKSSLFNKMIKHSGVLE